MWCSHIEKKSMSLTITIWSYFSAKSASVSTLCWISVFASTAPLLGLLGTVMGMIELFDVITMHGTSDPKLLAGGISIALVTTEAGLIVAIPLQLIHTFLTNMADSLRSRMESAGLAVLNALWVKESVKESVKE